MPRSYAFNRRPAVVELASGDALDASLDLMGMLERELGMHVHVEVAGDCLLFPPPHEVYRDGRTLRDEECEPYARGCLAAAAMLAVRSIRFAVEEMYPFAWDAFSKDHWAALQVVYDSLPGHMRSNDLPRWFGTDERTGPCLWASVEPPGLQVAGLLALASFDDWNLRFLAMTVDLPVRAR